MMKTEQQQQQEFHNEDALVPDVVVVAPVIEDGRSSYSNVQPPVLAIATAVPSTTYQHHPTTTTTSSNPSSNETWIRTTNLAPTSQHPSFVTVVEIDEGTSGSPTEPYLHSGATTRTTTTTTTNSSYASSSPSSFTMASKPERPNGFYPLATMIGSITAILARVLARGLECVAFLLFKAANLLHTISNKLGCLLFHCLLPVVYTLQFLDILVQWLSLLLIQILAGITFLFCFLFGGPRIAYEWYQYIHDSSTWVRNRLQYKRHDESRVLHRIFVRGLIRCTAGTNNSNKQNPHSASIQSSTPNIPDPAVMTVAPEIVVIDENPGNRR